MANRFPLVVTTGAANAVAEFASGDNLNLSGNNIIVNTDKLLTLPTTTDTLVGRDTSDTLTNKTLSQPVLFSPRIQDTSEDHRYIIGVSELTGDRTVTLPLLAGNDTFVFEAFAQTLTNKTLTNPTLNVGGGTIVLPQGSSASQTAEGSIFWDTDDNLLSIGDGSARKVFVDTTSTQTLGGKTLNNLTLTGTLTADGSAGTSGYILESTGTGVIYFHTPFLSNQLNRMKRIKNKTPPLPIPTPIAPTIPAIVSSKLNPYKFILPLPTLILV